MYRYVSKTGLNRQVTSAADRAALTKAGWVYRGISFYGGNPTGNPAVIDPQFSIAIMPDTQMEDVWDRYAVRQSHHLACESAQLRSICGSCCIPATW